MNLNRRVNALENRLSPTVNIADLLEQARKRPPLSREEMLVRIEEHRAKGFDRLARALERVIRLHPEKESAACLECGTADTPGMLIHWTIDEEAQALECNGQRFTRRDGEGHEDFMERVMVSLSAAPGKVLWLVESAA